MPCTARTRPYGRSWLSSAQAQAPPADERAHDRAAVRIPCRPGRTSMANEWNFADVWEVVAETVPDAIAQVHGDLRCDGRTFDRRPDGIAARLVAEGLARHDKVALYLYN